nr:COP9 signalosome complex subunit 1 [Hymenolepis microstoma]
MHIAQYNEKDLNEELMDTDTVLDGEAMKIVKSGNNEAGLVYDEEWVRSMASRVNKTRDHLETELKTSKINGIVVHARKAYIEMGDFWLKCGDFLNALRCYTRSREYSQSPGDDVNSCLKITRMAILQANWTQAGAYAKLAENCCEVDCTASKNTGNAEATEIFLKARRDGRDLFEYQHKNLPSEKIPDQLPIATQIAKAELHLIFGLLKLVTGDYRDSIEQFVQANIDPEECTFDNPSNFITHSDVARYVAVCALATLNRSALKTDILNHPSFRLVLESEVEARDLLLAFHSADYASVFMHLERLKSYLKLDIFAADHVEELYRMIRVKALHQYFVPFVRADLNPMAEAFGTSVTDLVGELAELIRTGTIKARIDYEKQLLCRSNVDDRNQTFKDTMRVIDRCHQRLQAAILRANIIRRGYAAGHQIGPRVW